jgi:hypothetical protein
MLLGFTVVERVATQSGPLMQCVPQQRICRFKPRRHLTQPHNQRIDGVGDCVKAG